MARKTLRFRDGFVSQRPELREDVRELQKALVRAGFSVDTDGLFGNGTQEAVKAFQRQHGLEADGVVGPQTWAALAGGEEESESLRQQARSTTERAAPVLPGFRGDLGWIHAREGHAGKAYWPGGASGVTLDPGVDLGHGDAEMIREAYKGLLSPEQFAAVERVFGIKGEAAKTTLAEDDVLQTIRISRSQAESIFPFVILPYWEAIVNRFPALADPDTLPSVQTALLSIAYNRGPRNRGLAPLGNPIQSKNWLQVAAIIGSMQQDHKLEGIRKRRRMEADLIRAELA